jgi:putative redox protein
MRTRSLLGAYRTAVSNGRHEIVADAPIDKGGGGTGFGAHELLEAALAACINMSVRMYATAQSIPLEDVSTEGSIETPCPDQVVFEYSLELQGLLNNEQRKLLARAAQECPVSQTLSKRLEFKAAK